MPPGHSGSWVDNAVLRAASQYVTEGYVTASKALIVDASGSIKSLGGLGLENSVWFISEDNAGTGEVNIIRVNTSDEIELGGTLLSGPIEFEEDSGEITAMNMPVTSAPSASATMSMAHSIGSTPILTVKAQADGIGGTYREMVVFNKGVAYNTTETSQSYSLLTTDYYVDVDTNPTSCSIQLFDASLVNNG